MSYCDFKPGDEVECIQSCPIAPVFTHKGERYVIESVRLVWGEPSLFFVGVPSGSPHWSFWVGREAQAFYGYNPARFRKVQRRDLTQWLSQTTDLDEEQRFPAPSAPAKKRERV